MTTKTNVNTEDRYKYLYPSTAEVMKKYDHEQLFVQKDLKINVYENAVVLPGAYRPSSIYPLGCVVYDGNCVEGTGWSADGRDFSYDYSDCEYFDTDVIYLGYFGIVYGHRITDCLKHTWAFLDPGIEESVDSGKLKMVYISTKPVSKNEEEILSYLGIDLQKAERVLRPTKFRSVTVAEPSFFRDLSLGVTRGFCYSTQLYKETVDKIIESALKTCPVKGDKKIYFTRTKLRSKKDFGEKSIVKEFKKLGFKIIAPEQLSLGEQISYLQGCDVFAATFGSVSHNAMFQKDGASNIVLLKATHMDYQMFIERMRNLNAVYIDSNLSLICKKRGNEGPFFLYSNKYFCDYFDAKKRLFPFSAFKRYLRNMNVLICRGDKEQIKQYTELNPDYLNALAEEMDELKSGVTAKLNKIIPFSSTNFGQRVVRALTWRIIYYS